MTTVSFLDVFRLSAVVAAGRVGIAVDAAHRGGIGVRVVAVAVELAAAEKAGAAENIEGHEHVVSLLEGLDRRARFLDHADELMAKGHPHARVRNQSMVKMEIGAADRGPRHADDRVIRMLDFGLRLLVQAHSIGAAVGHCTHAVTPSQGSSRFLVTSARAGPGAGSVWLGPRPYFKGAGDFPAARSRNSSRLTR